ncbi:response regulator [Sphingomonas sp.]|jgi:CheY-like chemotaxis protein|uniref:response regulator n=1 Tax=Sphingomonas sp. TaxID=28214 RepID=UPI002EDB9807
MSITDSGTGISADNLQKVFEPFFTTKGVGKGTGLGLGQVYGFARSSGGDVRVESELGRGTTMSLVLPCSDKPLPGSVAPAAAMSLSAGTHRLLLVEDDDSVAELVGEMLGELGYAFARVASAEAALDLLARDHRFDLVFSDMVMPGTMGGLDLARAIAKAWPALKIVLTTGYSEAAAGALADGHHLLTKPYPIEALASKLAGLLDDPK